MLLEKIFNFIKKINQFLLFFAAILVIYTFSNGILKKAAKDVENNYKQVDILSSEEIKKKKIKQKYTVKFSAKIMDVFIFRLMSPYVLSKEITKHNEKVTLDFFSENREKDKENTINLLFVNNNNEQHILFSNDVYVLAYEVAGSMNHTGDYVYDYTSSDSNDLKLPINLYRIISDDDNEDGVLSEKDNVSLYRSEYSGKKLKEIISGVEKYYLINEDTIIIAAKKESRIQYYEYLINSEQLREINTMLKRNAIM